MPSAPDTRLSVIVIGYATAPLLDRCLAAIREQRRAVPSAEVIVVAHERHAGSVLTDVKRKFADLTWVDAPESYNVARMRGLGVARSTGATVAFIEGDCVPAPDWMASAVRTTPSPATGGAIEPDAFTRALDWAAYFCEFARYMLPLPDTLAQLPGANVLYRRAALPEPARLEAEGFYETFVNAAVAQGGRLAGSSALVVRHARTWNARALLATRLHHGRGYAGLRTRGQPLAGRARYMVLALALPAVLVARVMAEPFRRRRLRWRALRALPWIVALSASWSLGELAGYAFGAGSSLEQWR